MPAVKCVVVSCALAVSTAAMAQVVLTPVLRSGDAVPGPDWWPEREFGRMGTNPQVAPDGTIFLTGGWQGLNPLESAVFIGRPGAWNAGLWHGREGPMREDRTKVIVLQRPTYGGGLNFIANSIIDGDTVNGSNDRAIVGGALGSDDYIVRSGFQTAGALGNWSQPDSVQRINAAGQYALSSGILSGRGIAVGGPGAGPQVIAQTSGPVLGGPAGSTHNSNIGMPVLSETGAVAYRAGYNQVSGGSRLAIFRYSNGAAQRIVTTSSPGPSVPGIPDGSILTSVDDPQIGDAGHMAFSGQMGGASAIWTTDAAGTQVRGIASTNTVMPGSPGTELRFFRNITVAPNGDVAFMGSYRSGGTTDFDNDERLWKYSNGAIGLWLAEGVQAPGEEAGVRVSPLSLTNINAMGHAGLVARLTGPGVTAENERALFGLDASGELVPVLRTGELFEFAPGDMRLIHSFDVAVGGGRALADDGTLIFRIEFADRTNGIYTVHIPAPAAWVLFCGLPIFAARRKRAAANS